VLYEHSRVCMCGVRCVCVCEREREEREDEAAQYFDAQTASLCATTALWFDVWTAAYDLKGGGATIALRAGCAEAERDRPLTKHHHLRHLREPTQRGPPPLTFSLQSVLNVKLLAPNRSLEYFSSYLVGASKKNPLCGGGVAGR
jgi:hypothetical protein